MNEYNTYWDDLVESNKRVNKLEKENEELKRKLKYLENTYNFICVNGGPYLDGGPCLEKKENQQIKETLTTFAETEKIIRTENKKLKEENKKLREEVDPIIAYDCMNCWAKEENEELKESNRLLRTDSISCDKCILEKNNNLLITESKRLIKDISDFGHTNRLLLEANYELKKENEDLNRELKYYREETTSITALQNKNKKLTEYNDRLRGKLSTAIQKVNRFYNQFHEELGYHY